MAFEIKVVRQSPDSLGWQVNATQQTFNISYDVYTFGEDNDVDQGVRDIKLHFQNTSSLPYIGSHYSDGTGDIYLVVNDFKVSLKEQVDGKLEVNGTTYRLSHVFKVSITYTDTPEQEAEDADTYNDWQADPTLKPAEISWSTWTEEYFPWNYMDKGKRTSGGGSYAINPKPIVNSAGEPYAPEQITTLKYHPVVTITQIEDTYNSEAAEEFLGTINSKFVQIAGRRLSARTARLDQYDGNKIWIRGRDYYRITYKISIDKDGWNPVVLVNMGQNELNADNELVPVRKNGVIVKGASILDANGQSVDVKEKINDSASWTPSTNDFYLYEEKYFQTLNLPIFG